MLFAAYLGAEKWLAAWQGAVQGHADWLGLGHHHEARLLADGRTFAFAFFGGPGRTPILLPSVDDSDYLILGTMAGALPGKDVRTSEDLRSRLTDETPPAAIRVSVSLRTGELTAAVPVTSVEPLFLARHGDGWALSTDLRFLARLSGAQVDERGIYAFLRFGAIPPPLSLFRGIHRVPNGHLLRITPGSGEPDFEVFFHLDESLHSKGQLVNPEGDVTAALDGVLGALPGPVIVYFSGGVDSSLLAARFAVIGRSDFALVNASFGPGDASAQLAQQMAAHLGLRCEQVPFSPTSIPVLLQRLGREYVYPFGDPATLPGNLLVHESRALVPSARSAVTGVGAGPMFGQGLWICRQQMRAGRLPRPVVWVAGEGYKALHLWRHPSLLERSAGTLRRLGGLSLAQATLCQNALDGIAYQTPADLSHEIQKTIRDYTEVFGRGATDFLDERRILHAVKYSAHDFSAIIHAPLAVCGVRAANPYIEPRMLRLAASLTQDDLCPEGVLKGLLKKMLARSVPPELVHTHARSFVPPFREIFNHDAMRDFLQGTVLAPDNPLLEYVRVDRVREMVGRIQNGKPIASGARKLVWTFIFASAWLRQTAETR